ncbi:ribosome biogenesis protein YTM1 [Xylariomycetidae sp. FL2044]|nr:ribosome biogenesis protein YTM1 [Xylariomycetidae sp. FL2044]
MDSALGQPPMAEPNQVRVNFTTTSPDLQLPEGKSQLLVPADIKRYGLSRVLNSESMLDTPSPIPLDFLVNGTFLRTSIEDYLKAHGLSLETTLTLQYVRSLIPPVFQASFEHDDWVSDVDALSATSRAGAWAGDKFVTGRDRLLTASYDGLVRIWNPSGAVIATSPLVGHNKAAVGLKAAKFLSPTQVTSAGLDRTVRVWRYSEADDGLSGVLKPTLELYGHKAGIESLAVQGPTGRILSAGSDGAVGLWSTSKASLPPAPASLLPGANASSAKRRKLESSSSTTAAPQRGPLSLLQIHAAPATAVAFDPADATVAYSASEDHSVRTLDLTTSKVESVITTSHPLTCLAALPKQTNGATLLAAGTSARHVTVIDPRVSATATSVMTLRGHRNLVSSVCGSAENEYSLVSGSYDGTCRIWDLRSVRAGSRAEGGGSVSESVYVIEREEGGSSSTVKRSAGDVPGRGEKVFGVCWDRAWGIVSAGEDRRVQLNRGADLLAGSS